MTERRFVSTRRNGDVLTLKVEVPELRDPELAYAVRDELVDIVADEGVKNLVVDLADVTYMGSVGLLALLSVRRLAFVERIVICNVNDPLRGIVLTSRLAGPTADRTKPFELASDLEQAEALLGIVPISTPGNG
jgi:anti-anti-sigma factor